MQSRKFFKNKLDPKNLIFFSSVLRLGQVDFRKLLKNGVYWRNGEVYQQQGCRKCVAAKDDFV